MISLNAFFAVYSQTFYSFFFFFFIMIAALCFCRFSDILYTQVKPNTPNSLLLKTGRSSSVIKGAEPIWSKVGLLFQRLITVNNSHVID